MSPRRTLLALSLLLAAVLAIGLGAPTPVRAAEPPMWDWPVMGPPPVSRAYRAPATRYGAGHRGIDLEVEPGSPIRSPDDGVVHFAGVVGDRPVLSIRHEDGLLSSFEPVDAAVAVGDAVARGQVVGTLSSSSGHCPRDCLHVGARLDGRYLSPLALLATVPPPVLLPLEGQARG